MSSNEMAEPLIHSTRTNRHAVHRILALVAILLCLYGIYESVDAAVTVLKRRQPSTGVNAFFDYPVWSLFHFIPGFIFMTVTPFQLWRGFRNRHRKLHRWAGRLVVSAGMIIGFSGITLPFVMPERPFSEKIAMSSLSVAFLFFLTKAISAALKRDFERHREWMIRWFIVGLGVTTQRLMLPLFIGLIGIRDMRGFWELFVTALWLSAAIQITIAEWWISATRFKSNAFRG
jgi:uncharacterized membrane protein